MNPPSRITLVGFMGAGKSTVGKLVAARLGYRFEDLDERIEALASIPVAEIFRTRGESSFRALEREAIEDLLRNERLVIATGGGAFAQPECASALLAHSFTVHLSCEFAAAWRRVAAETGRPLVEKGETTMAALYAERKDKYSRAHATVDTTHRSPKEVADAVLAVVPST